MFRRLLRFLKLYFATYPIFVYMVLALRDILSPSSGTKQYAVTSMPGRTILFVDGSTPQSDRDAGAVSIIQFMQLFAEQGWQVHLWPFDQLDRPQARLELESKGICVILKSKSPYAFREWISCNPMTYSVVLISRPALTALLMPWLHCRAFKLAYYGHDLHALRFQQEALLTGHRELLLISRRYRKIEERICAFADCSYYPSAYEVLALEAAVPCATIKELPPYAYNLETFKQLNPPPNTRFLFVGNFDHLPNVDSALWLLDEIWPLILGRVINAHLTIAGARPPAFLIKRAKMVDPEIAVTGWVSVNRLTELYSISRVVVVPLRYGAGIKHKVVHAVMMGRPVVTTDVGLQGLPELEPIVALAKNAEQFASECEKLINSDDIWSVKAFGARKALARRFSRESMWHAFQDLHHDI